MVSLVLGDEVGWRWGSGLATGVVVQICPHNTRIISNGSEIVRNGTPDDPAVIIGHKSGNKVLKLAHELRLL